MIDENQDLQKQLEAKREELERIKAQALVEVVADPTKAVATKVSQAVAHKIDTDKTVSKKVDSVAAKIIDKGLQANTKQADAAHSAALAKAKDQDFANNKEEYLHHGVQGRVQPWQSTMMIWMNNIWFVILSIIFFFTFVPFSMFMSRIKALSGILKFVAITIGVSLLLIILASITFWVLHVTNVWSIFA